MRKFISKHQQIQNLEAQDIIDMSPPKLEKYQIDKEEEVSRGIR